MGRKIPGRKHHGVKDPNKQAIIRFNSIKDKINTPPENPDDQQIPKSLQRVIDLKSKVKNGIIGSKRKKKPKAALIQLADNDKMNLDVKSKTRPEKPIPKFEQRPNETDKQFLHRISIICQNVTREAAFENKYGVDIKRNESGKVEEVVKRSKDELEILMKKMRKENKNKKTKKKKNKEKEGPKLTKSQKWQKKKKEKKLKKKLKDVDEFQNYKDNVKFGETAHAPPTLITPKKAQKMLNAPRPGKKPLLLKSISENKNKPPKVLVSKSETNLQKISNKVIDRKGKRKDLPVALRRQLDIQQKEIISAYKTIKAKNYLNR